MTKNLLWPSLLEDYLLQAYKTEVLGEYIYSNKVLEEMDYIEELVKITEDLGHHKEMLEELFKEMDTPLTKYVTKQDVFELYLPNIDLTEPKDLVKNVLVNENIMISLYKELKKKTHPEMIKSLWLKNDADKFFKTIDQLIKSEENHQDLIKKFLENEKFLKRILDLEA